MPGIRRIPLWRLVPYALATFWTLPNLYQALSVPPIIKYNSDGGPGIGNASPCPTVVTMPTEIASHFSGRKTLLADWRARRRCEELQPLPGARWAIPHEQVL